MIRILDEALIDKIAAGEVIERPASVVKELVENSLDAAAGRVFIEVVDGGKTSIKVTDDGSGMSRSDAISCTKRHATSKIRNESDLAGISTLGFRGEALSSIAAVSRLAIRTNNGSSATLVREGRAESIARARGTTVIVDDLFYNTPARKKHLGSSSSEFRHIHKVVTSVALCHPGVYIQLLHNSRPVLDAPVAQGIIENASSILGPGVARSLLDISNHRLRGCISRPGYQAPTASNQYLYINSRPVRSPVLREAIYSGYRAFLNVGRHPAFILDIQVDASEVDVNVHPQKSIVRIENEDEIGVELMQAIARQLGRQKPEQPRLEPKAVDATLTGYRPAPVQRELPGHAKREFTVLGQAMNTYILAQVKGELLIIDQHAAQERVKYEKYMEQYRGRVEVQQLVSPVTVELSPAEAQLVQSNLKMLENLGFVLEEFGGNSFNLRAVPEVLGRIAGPDVLMSAIGESGSMGQLQEELIIRKACRASVKANQRLEQAEMERIVQRLFGARQPKTCPHGRPTMVRLTVAEMEKMFRRRL